MANDMLRGQNPERGCRKLGPADEAERLLSP